MAWRMLGIGWYIALCLVLGAFIGYKLDEKYGTAPWIAFAGVTVGLAVALVGAFSMILPLMREGQREDKEEDNQKE